MAQTLLKSFAFIPLGFCATLFWRTTGARQLGPTQTDIDFAINISPLFRAAKFLHEGFKSIAVFGRVLEPREEVKRLGQFPTVMKSSGDAWQVLNAHRDMMRLLLEDGSPFVLSKRPPSI